MTDRVCYAYTLGFLQHLRQQGLLQPAQRVGLAGDLRASSPAIMAACAAAVDDFGALPCNYGFIPSPAIANYGLRNHMPTLMVTGSHIPDDRNGIKFNRADGEILKTDEQGIRAQQVEFPEGRFGGDGRLLSPSLPAAQTAAMDAYLQRFIEFFPPACLQGLRIGLYEHSSVARDPYHAVLTALGAEVTSLGRTDIFMPVDTEAIRPEDVSLAHDWAAQGDFDALLSADGDGDRPLVGDQYGRWMRGDIAGILCARYLRASGVVTPVSSNTAVDLSGWFAQVLRSRIGSPYVIEGMNTLRQQGLNPVVGYEANGGFLQADPITLGGRTLAPLPTRDALIVALAVLALARQQGVTLADLGASLPARYTCSNRIKEFPVELSRQRLAGFNSGDSAVDKQVLEAVFADAFGSVAEINTIDGLRVTFSSGEIAHLRPSGNAPELRAYTEADSEQRALEMNQICMQILSSWR
jgi:phosphomannomutase